MKILLTIVLSAGMVLGVASAVRHGKHGGCQRMGAVAAPGR